jgi:predicted secreted acid phosphatase
LTAALRGGYTFAMKQTAVIFDMDGTLADVSSIRHYVRDNKNYKGRNFDKFHRESVNVPPHRNVVNHAQVAHMLGHAVIIVTARKERWRNHTAMWLALNNVPSDAMFMRKDKDSRKDYFVKSDILEVIQYTWDVIHAVDDNPNIIKLWQERNIPTTIIEGWEDGA